MNRLAKKWLSTTLALLFLLGTVPAPAFAADGTGGSDWQEMEAGGPGNSERIPLHIEKIGEGLADDPVAATAQDEGPVDEKEMVRVTILLAENSALDAGFELRNIGQNAAAISYRRELSLMQDEVAEEIENEVLEDGQQIEIVWNMTLLLNAISANVPRGLIDEIEAIDGVKSVVEERHYYPQVISTDWTAQPNMAVSGQMNGAQTAWQAGYTGAGTTIAIIDSGLDTQHISFDPDAFDHAISTLDGFDQSLLMDKADIEAVLSQLNVLKKNSAITAEQLYVNHKVPFGFNYKDVNTNIGHLEDTQTPHGSHVAGIAAGNRFLKSGDEFVDALTEVNVVGNAPDAQLLIMKVFGQSGASTDADIMVAIEDALTLGADVINMSLGGVEAGLVTAVDEVYQPILDKLVNTGTLMVVAAGNNAAWADETDVGALYSDGVNFDTVGAPASYTNAFSVASVQNDGVLGKTFQLNGTTYGYTDTSEDYGKSSFASLDTTEEKSGTDYKFVIVDPELAGKEEECAGALKGVVDENTIVVVWRGGETSDGELSSFPMKGNAFAKLNPKAVIVANNASGILEMSFDGYTGNCPMVFTTQIAGNAMWSSGEPKTIQVEDLTVNYVEGTLTVIGNGKGVAFFDSDRFTMSPFSSWGVPGDLSINPEITAPGGNIYSVNGAHKGSDYTLDVHNTYTTASGTSMASPQVAGIVSQVQQYVRESGISVDGLNTRALIQSLIMSTARQMQDDKGNYFPVIQQGAGLINAASAVSTPVTLTVEDTPDGKVKVQLGDDPDKNGVYSFRFTFHNFSGNDQRYSLDADVFTQLVETVKDYDFLTQSVRAMEADVSFYSEDGMLLNTTGEDLENYDFNGDGLVNRADAQRLLDHINGVEELTDTTYADLNGDGEISSYDVHVLLKLLAQVVTVPAGKSVTVTCEFSLTDDEKAKLKKENPAGAYVEMYVHADAIATTEGVIAPDLGIPVLGYYGNWSDPSMFNDGTAAQWIMDDSVYGGYLYGFDRTPYLWNDITGVTNALTISDTPVADGTAVTEFSTVDDITFTLIRNAGESVIRTTWTDADGTEHTRWSENLGAQCAAYNDGAWHWTRTSETIGRVLTDDEGKEYPDGTRVTYTLFAAPEYYARYGYNWAALTDGDTSNGELGEGAALTNSIVVDSAYPEVVGGDDKTYYTTDTEGDYHIFVTVKDSVSIASVALYGGDGPDVIYEYNEEYKNFKNTAPNEEETLEFDGLYYYAGSYGFMGPYRGLEENVYTVVVTDTVGHQTTYRIWADVEKEQFATDMTLSAETLTVFKGKTEQLKATVNPIGLEDRSVTWESSNKEVATVAKDGTVTALSNGTTTITATSSATTLDGTHLKQSCEVTVLSADVTIKGIAAGGVVHDHMSFTWDVQNNNLSAGTLDLPDHLNSDGRDSNGPIGVGKVDENSYYVFTSGNHMYLMNSETNEPVADSREGSKWRDDLLNYTMAWSTAYDGGLDWSSGYLLMVGADPTKCDVNHAFNLTNDGENEISGIASINRHWELEIDGEKKSGELILVAFTEQNDVFTLYLTRPEGEVEYTAYIIKNKSDLTIHPNHWTDGIASSFLGSCVDGGDGALYYSYHYTDRETNTDKNPVYRVYFDAEKNIWHADSLGGVSNFSPALIVDVQPNSGERTELVLPQPSDENEVTERESQMAWGIMFGYKSTENEDEKTLTCESAVADTTANQTGTEDSADAAKAGKLQSVDVSGDEQHTGATSGISVNSYAGTVTVPVYATGSTNGTFTFTYDPEILVFNVDAATAGDALVSVNGAVPGTVTVAFAAHDVMDGQLVASLVFGYDVRSSNYTSQLTLKVTEDETDDELSEHMGRMANLLPDDIVYTLTLTAPVYIQPTPNVTTADKAEDGEKVTETTATPDVSVNGGEAKATVSPSMGREIVNQAEANGSDTVVVAPKVPESAGKATVTIPGSTVSELGQKTDADLKVKAPAGSVTLPNDSLEELGQGDVDITLEKSGDSFTFDVEVNGQSVSAIPGGVKVQVPLNDGEVVVIVSEDGTETVVPKSIVEDGMTYAILEGPCTLEVRYNAKAFKDVPEGSWYEDAVEFVSSHNLFLGTAESEFSPEEPMNRAMMATVLWRVQSLEDLQTVGDFSDVPDGAWYAEGVAWAESAGIINGYGDGTFGPLDSITRGQMVLMLYRFAQYVGMEVTGRADLSGYADAVEVEDWYKDAMEWAVSSGIIFGSDENRLNPNAEASRTEIATVIERLVRLMVK